jgi:hypothetical protein
VVEEGTKKRRGKFKKRTRERNFLFKITLSAFFEKGLQQLIIIAAYKTVSPACRQRKIVRERGIVVNIVLIINKLKLWKKKLLLKR